MNSDDEWEDDLDDHLEMDMKPTRNGQKLSLFLLSISRATLPGLECLLWSVVINLIWKWLRRILEIFWLFAIGALLQCDSFYVTRFVIIQCSTDRRCRENLAWDQGDKIENYYKLEILEISSSSSFWMSSSTYAPFRYNVLARISICL